MVILLRRGRGALGRLRRRRGGTDAILPGGLQKREDRRQALLRSGGVALLGGLRLDDAQDEIVELVLVELGDGAVGEAGTGRVADRQLRGADAGDEVALVLLRPFAGLGGGRRSGNRKERRGCERERNGWQSEWHRFPWASSDRA